LTTRSGAACCGTMTAIDLGGSWVGHYEQGGGRHGISMHVAQRGGSFVGRMRDVDTVLASREQVHAQTGEGDARTTILLGEADVLSTLPEHSIVEGDVDGRIVTFVKRYKGSATRNVWIADKPAIAMAVSGHEVHYRGAVDAAGTELAGHWSIPARGGSPTIRGRFVLRRIAR
jgi:hypothetical protein